MVTAAEADPLAGLAATVAAGRAAGARADEAERTAAGLQYLVGQEAGLAGREAELARLNAAVALAVGRVERLEAARHELPAQIAELDERLTGARVAAGGLADAEVQLDAVMVRLAAAARAEDLAGGWTSWPPPPARRSTCTSSSSTPTSRPCRSGWTTWPPSWPAS